MLRSVKYKKTLTIHSIECLFAFVRNHQKNPNFQLTGTSYTVLSFEILCNFITNRIRFNGYGI